MNSSAILESPAFKVLPMVPRPQLYYLEGFLTPEECQSLIESGSQGMAPSVTVDPETGEMITVESRTSSSAFLNRNQTPTVTAVERRIANLVHVPVEHGEPFQVLHYGVGQEYRPHFDFFDPALKGSAKVLSQGGQRIITVILYLNTVEAGGGTAFVEINKGVAPKQGDGILFYNVLPNGQPDPMTLHAGLPVEAGEKWIATKWIRQNPYG